MAKTRGTGLLRQADQSSSRAGGAVMIKRVMLLTRKTGMTREQFTRHWLDVHAPLAHAVPGLRRYVQSHIVVII